MSVDQILACEEAVRCQDDLFFESPISKPQLFSVSNDELYDFDSLEERELLSDSPENIFKSDILNSEGTHEEASPAPQKNKRIKKGPKHEDYVADPYVYRKSKKEKKKPPKDKEDGEKSQYPTKNLLQNLKTAHLEYLKKHLPPYILQKSKLVMRLMKTNKTNLQDYTDLYNIADFRATFAQMFEEKYLYRSLMLSRCEPRAKKNHSKKIEVFEEGFRNRKLTNIN